ncbi:MAG: hypothetical protein P8Z41_17485, partial [Anaerolineales bacterium]
MTSDLNLSSAEISYNGGSSWSGLSPDGSGSWSTNWDTQTVSNGSYSVRARGRDQAGNVGGVDAVTIMVDNGEPHIYIPDSWPIWQTVAINVVDNGIGVDRVRLTIHAGSYGERVYNWNSGQDEFRWDRYIDGVSMPIGGYPVEVEAWDRVGNKGAAWGEIVIPAPDEVEEDEEEPGVLSVEPPEEPPAESPSTSGESEPVSQPTNTPEPPKVVMFGGESNSTGESSGAGEILEIAPPAGSSNLLAGAAAVAVIGAAMIVVTAAKKKREDEEKQKAAAADMFNKQQIALEEYQAQKAAQAKWEAEQSALATSAPEGGIVQANQEATAAAVQGDSGGITTGQSAPAYFTYVEAEKQRQREEEARRKQEERDLELAATTCPVDFGSTTSSTSSIDIISTIPRASSSPVLEPVPSFWSNPIGWVQAKAINAGRQNEKVGETIVTAALDYNRWYANMTAPVVPPSGPMFNNSEFDLLSSFPFVLNPFYQYRLMQLNRRETQGDRYASRQFTLSQYPFLQRLYNITDNAL